MSSVSTSTISTVETSQTNLTSGWESFKMNRTPQEPSTWWDRSQVMSHYSSASAYKCLTYPFITLLSYCAQVIQHPKIVLPGPLTSNWTLHHVSLNATKHFQVEFEVRKGAGSSNGGFSIDDINLSETECAHVTIQLNDFNANIPKVTYSPRQYSAEGYAYRIWTSISQSNNVMFLQLVSGDYDDKLQWPCSYRQVTFQILDQNPNIQLQMSKRLSYTTDPTLLYSNSKFTKSNIFLKSQTQVQSNFILNMSSGNR